MTNISMGINNTRRIFIDTWAWYALTDVKDTDHLQAETTNTELIDAGHLFLTTNYVLSETLTLIRYKLSHSVAVKFWKTTQQLFESGLLEFVRVSETHEENAWTIFERYVDQDFSFVDCTSFAVMQQRQLSHVFTGDHHFTTMGFLIIP